ncbi:Bax inhibitor-1/YccA family protein [Nesterenkonia alkaliphila]|nr:Bax inhibitor-1/YccA family protein [Nesterenkonia alkaliphila]GFZ92154.1 hypothetical protein GCM10011359_21790 [Nesterenkonia alkaliphila]
MAMQFGNSSNPVFRSGAMPDQFNADKRRRFYMDSNAGTVREDTQQTYAQQHGVPGPDQLQQQYNMPAHAGREGLPMTYDDVIRKTVTSFAVVLLGAGAAVTLATMMPGLVMGLTVVAVLAGLVLGLVNAFRREPNPGLILAYSATQGFFLGAITWVLELQFPGIAFQAVAATLIVFGCVLVAFKSGKIRATPKLNKMFMIALGAYLIFALFNFGLMLFGGTSSMFGLRTEFSPWIGIAIGAFAILLATYSLVLDFTNIDEGVKAGVEQKYGWAAAFGLTVSLVWLYIEILRIIAIVRSMAD